MNNNDLLDILVAHGVPGEAIVRVAKLIADAEQAQDRRARNTERMRTVRTHAHTQVHTETQGGDIDSKKEPSSLKEVSKKERKQSISAVTNPEFDEFWEAYPKRQGDNPKAPARKKFQVARQRGVSSESLLNGARGYAEKVVHDKIEPRFVAQAVTWLNQERWADYTEAVESTAKLLEFHRQQCALRNGHG